MDTQCKFISINPISSLAWRINRDGTFLSGNLAHCSMKPQLSCSKIILSVGQCGKKGYTSPRNQEFVGKIQMVDKHVGLL